MRTLGIIIISLIPTAVGALAYQRLAKSYRLLRDIKQLCLVLSEQMRFSLKSPTELFEFIKREPNFSRSVKEIIEAVSQKTEYGEIFSSIEALPDGAYIKGQIGPLCDMFYGLGKSDLEAQLSHLGYFSALFSAEEERVKEELNTKSRLWLGLSFSLSAAVFVILI